MEWEVVVHQDLAEQLSRLPSDWQPQFEAAFSKLASDPKGLGHSPVLPHSWKGPLWDFRVRDSNGHMLNVTVFFLFDDDPDAHKIHLHDMNVISVYYGEPKTSKDVERQPNAQEASLDDGSVVEIPQRNPR